MTDSYEENREYLIRLLQAVPLMQRHDGRESVLDEMRARHFDLSVSSISYDIVHCARIIDAAMSRHGGLQRLAGVVCFLDMSDSALNFRQHVEKWYSNEFLSPVERNRLLRDLSLYVPQHELITYYRIATNELAGQKFENLDAVMREIEQLSWDGSGHPLIRLTEAIAKRARLDHVAEAARRWSDFLAERIDTAANQAGEEREGLERLRASETALSATALGRATLLLELNPSLHRPDHYRFTADLFLGDIFVDKIYQSDDDNPLTLPLVRETLSRVLRAALIMADEVDGDASQMDLEFVLPRNLLCTPIEEWTDHEPTYMSLAIHFVVVVRDLDRQRDPVLRMGWLRKWAKVVQDDGLANAGLDQWITCTKEQCEPGQVFYDLLKDECVSLGLTFRPGDGAHEFDLGEVLDAGMPIVIWPRQCEHSAAPVSGLSGNASADFEEKLSQRLVGRRLTDLPRIVYELRKEAGADRGRGMTLLWDDPTRRAEPDDFNLDAPPWGRTA